MQNWQFMSLMSNIIKNYPKILKQAITDIYKNKIPLFPSINLVELELQKLGLTIYKNSESADLQNPKDLFGCSSNEKGEISIKDVRYINLEGDVKSILEKIDGIDIKDFVFISNIKKNILSPNLPPPDSKDYSLDEFLDKMDGKDRSNVKNTILNVLQLKDTLSFDWDNINHNILPFATSTNEFRTIFFTASAISVIRQFTNIKGKAKTWLNSLLFSDAFIGLYSKPDGGSNYKSYKSYWGKVYDWWNNNIQSSEYLMSYYLINIMSSRIKEFFYTSNLSSLLDSNQYSSINGESAIINNNLLIKKGTIQEKDIYNQEINKVNEKYKSIISEFIIPDKDGGASNLDDDKLIIENSLAKKKKLGSVKNFLYELRELGHQDIEDEEIDNLSMLYLRKGRGYNDIAKDLIIEDYHDYFKIANNLQGGTEPSTTPVEPSGEIDEIESIPENYQNFRSLLSNMLEKDSPLSWNLQLSYYLFKYTYLQKQMTGDIPIGLTITGYCKLNEKDFTFTQLNQTMGQRNFELNAELGYNIILKCAILEDAKETIYTEFTKLIAENGGQGNQNIENLLQAIKDYSFLKETFKKTKSSGQILFNMTLQDYILNFYSILKVLGKEKELQEKMIELITSSISKASSNFSELRAKVTLFVTEIAPQFQKPYDSYFKTLEKSKPDAVINMWKADINSEDFEVKINRFENKLMKV